MSDMIYPHFIKSSPCGIDKYEGKSQYHLTKAIVGHIRNTDMSNNQFDLSRIIGLEGAWGVGKSNVIKQLEAELGNQYKIFEYDAWGHQEDLQRRSFLETLTSKLINDKFLQGNVDDVVLNTKTTWEDKLKNLLASKKITINKTIPKLDAGAKWIAIAIALVPVTSFIAEKIDNQCLIKNIPLLGLISFSPVVALIFIILIIKIALKIIKKDFYPLSYFFQISKSENIETRNIETIFEDEPTVAKFKSWMADISNYIIKNSKPRLVIVFDNMDRLPKEKVKELWSSIHTFFSEDGYDSIWTIIPFDREHLASAFGESENDTSNGKLVEYFINKTFPIVYRVPYPVITDYKKVFLKLFEEAFGEIEKAQQEGINRIFRIEKPNASIREMIVFINELVTLYTMWQNDVSLFNMAIFVLEKDLILSDPVKQILSGEYLSYNLKNITQNNELLQKEIAVLLYGITPEYAEQIPLVNYIKSSLSEQEGYDINEYAHKNHDFIDLLIDAIKEYDVSQIDKVIKVLYSLEVFGYSDNELKSLQIIWDDLSIQKMKITREKQQFEDTFKLLLEMATDTVKIEIVEYICKSVQHCASFEGKQYYNALESLRSFLAEKKMTIELPLEDITSTPEIFIEYLNMTGSDYKKFKLDVDRNEFDKYLTSQVPDKISDKIVFALQSIRTDNDFPFTEFKEAIKQIISSNGLNATNFGCILNSYKYVAKEKPLSTQLNDQQKQSLWNSILNQPPNSSGYYDIFAMQIGGGQNLALPPGGEINKIADCIDYYADYGKLLIANLSWNIPVLKQVLKSMTERNLGQHLEYKEVLPKFFEIKQSIGVTEEALLVQFNRWHKHNDSITSGNIQDVLPNVMFFKYSTLVSNELTVHINKMIYGALANISTDILYQNKNNINESYYWFGVVKFLLNTNMLQPLPVNLTDFTKKMLVDIATGNQTIPAKGDILDVLVNNLERRKTSSTIIDIRNRYCNGTCNISASLFMFFESWLRQQGNFEERAGDTTIKIVFPIINNETCLDTILTNVDFYSKIINIAGDDANELKDMIEKKAIDTKKPTLIAFAEKIGKRIHTEDVDNS